MTTKAPKAVPNVEKLFCHGTFKAYTWILPNVDLDDDHYGHLMCWGCCECGNGGTTVWGKVFPREQWGAFKVPTDQGKVETEGYVLGNWALTPYSNETVITYLPNGQRLPVNFSDWDKALQTLRTLHRNLPKVEKGNREHLTYLQRICNQEN